MMTKPPKIPAPYWGYYFNVVWQSTPRRRGSTAGGGKILNGPMEVPGGRVDRPMHGPARRPIFPGGAEALSVDLREAPRPGVKAAHDFPRSQRKLVPWTASRRVSHD